MGNAYDWYRQSCCTPVQKTFVRTVSGNSKSIEVKVGIHQGSALSPLLLAICRPSDRTVPSGIVIVIVSIGVIIVGVCNHS